MTLPVANLVKDAVETLFSVGAEDKTVQGSRQFIQTLNELRVFLNRQYPIAAVIAQTDAADAGVSEFIGGGEGDALSVGDVFRVSNATNDLTDNAFATAKGSAVAANDIYIVDGADSVEFLGNNEGHAFDFSGETGQDFSVIS